MENRKLSQDVAVLHRDKKFLVKSMDATKARNEVLEPLAQKLQVSWGITLGEHSKRTPQPKICDVLYLVEGRVYFVTINKTSWNIMLWSSWANIVCLQ